MKLFLILAAMALASCARAEPINAPAPMSVIKSANSPESSSIGWPVVQCSNNPCIIEEDHGGFIALYKAQARKMVSKHTKLIIDGPCLSACTIMVDINRDNTCLTDNAMLGYHQWSRTDKDGKELHGDVTFDTPGLNDYIKKHGGLPDPESGDLLVLNDVEAGQFYKHCAQ